MLLWILSGSLLLFGSFDVWYFLRASWMVIKSWFQGPVRDVLAEQVVHGRVFLHDLDFMCHMNNARYLRECDFARYAYCTRNGLFLAARALDASMLIGATTIRYRRSLAFGEAFELRTRIVAWDEKSFYMEQRFVSKTDGFVSAVMLCRQNVIRGNPQRVLDHLCKRKVCIYTERIMCLCILCITVVPFFFFSFFFFTFKSPKYAHACARNPILQYSTVVLNVWACIFSYLKCYFYFRHILL